LFRVLASLAQATEHMSLVRGWFLHCSNVLRLYESCCFSTCIVYFSLKTAIY